MPDKPTCHWIIAGIFGALMGAILGFVLSFLIETFGGEWLGHGGWPPESLYLLFAVFGTSIAVVMEVRRARRERRRAERLVNIAEVLGLDYSFEVAELDYSAWRELPVIQKWFAARNRLHGTVGDVPVEMLDYEYVIEGSEDTLIDGEHGPVGGKEDSYYDQTVVLLPAGERELPSFHLLARSFHTWLAGMVGQEGFRFSTEGLSHHDVADVERFEKAYLLVANVEMEPTASADADSGESSGESPIQRLFSLRTIRFLANHPGWTVEGHGQQLAFYRSRKIVPAAGRRRFLDEALALRAALVEPRDKAFAVTPVADTSSTPEADSDRMIGMVIGAFSGFVLGGLVGIMLAVWTLSHFDDRNSKIVLALFLGAVPFFGTAIGGLIFGAIIGRRSLAGLLASIRRKRRERLLVEHPDRWPGQPPESTATVEQDGDTLIVSLPPVSLVRPIGCLLCTLVVLLNVMLPALTLAFLQALFDLDPIAVVLITAGWLTDILVITILFYHGRLRTRVSISSDQLMVEHHTLFGVRRHELPAARITRFDECIPPQAWGNAWLSIESTGRLWPLSLFRNRHNAEVAWLAKLIKDRMTLPESQP